MIYLPVIPYLIGVALTKDSPTNVWGQSKFNVQINTTFTNISAKPLWKGNAGLSFDMRCWPSRMNGLNCYIEQSSIRHFINDVVKQDLLSNVDEKVFTVSPFNYSHVLFEVKFDVKGPTMCDMEKRDNISDIERSNLLTMCQMIWYHLSIGVDITSKGSDFQEIENSMVGTCPVLYNIITNNYFIKRSYKLSPLIVNDNFKLYHNKTVDIIKNRFLNECSHNNIYIFGEKLWTNLIPTLNFNVKTKKSKSRMSFSEHNFNTTTRNLYDLYDNVNYKVATILEKIQVVLKSVVL